MDLSSLRNSLDSNFCLFNFSKNIFSVIAASADEWKYPFNCSKTNINNQFWPNWPKNSKTGASLRSQRFGSSWYLGSFHWLWYLGWSNLKMVVNKVINVEHKSNRKMCLPVKIRIYEEDPFCHGPPMGLWWPPIDVQSWSWSGRLERLPGTIFQNMVSKRLKFKNRLKDCKSSKG